MKAMTVGGGVLVLALVTAMPAVVPKDASGTWTAQAEAASMNLGGRRLTCTRGKATVDNGMAALGLARPADRTFWLNQRRLRRYPRAFQHFVFLHECAHMFMRDERSADCWAIKRGVFRGLFNAHSIKQICQALWSTPAGHYHMAGPDRCNALMACYKRARKR